ncbi:hypothetical protein BO78DRAFT_381172 [Aspergillus sclerotiicarbonarius CBS 121057]|uniref:Actin-like ATPase domain-containing protein n=1 Tax=Aspergillus sclerotiicarbonarius (strain CBS 121057 / IBT 28362) TaxID=1448318 RepID=A0A319DW25_ASPSB|nr:hypothetical protein BO78DRAFT_381172 [Aspergillus sclerotiicarbonarius CBS 121057]
MLDRVRLITVLCLLLQLVVCVMTSDEYPLGINLGPTSITAAYVNGDNETMPLVQTEGTLEYQEHMKQLLADSELRRIYIDGQIHIKDGDDYVLAPESVPSYSSDKAEMIAALLHQVKDQAAHYLHRPINITAYSLPRGLDSVSWKHLCDSVFETNVTILNFSPYRSDFLDAVRKAYRLDECVGFGLREGCDMVSAFKAIFFIDIGRGGLVNLWAGHVDEVVVRINEGDHVVSAYEYGKFEEQLPQILRAFMDEKMSDGMADNLGAVILSGDASQEEMHAIKQTVYLALPESWRPLLRAEIDPSYVAAIGIARIVKRHIDNSCFPEKDDFNSYMKDPLYYDVFEDKQDYSLEETYVDYIPGDEEYPFTSKMGCELS